LEQQASDQYHDVAVSADPTGAVMNHLLNVADGNAHLGDVLQTAGLAATAAGAAAAAIAVGRIIWTDFR